MAVVQFPVHTKYALGLRLGRSLRLICLYLPPSLSNDEVSSVLVSLPLTDDTIICGDLNARLGAITGDSVANARGSVLLRWCEEHGLSVLNSTLAPGVPTFLSYRGGQVKQSMIDYFLTNTTSALRSPRMQVYSDLSLGSDHKLLSLSFDYAVPDGYPSQPVLSSSSARRLWNLSRLKEPDVCSLYVASFQSLAAPLVDQFKALKSSPPSAAPSIDALNDSLNEAIYSALDKSVGSRSSRPSQWKPFWNAHLQELADVREHHYRRWRRAIGIDKALWWDRHQAAQVRFRAALKSAKRLSWRAFCDSLARGELARAMSKVKVIRNRRRQQVGFTHPDGPAAGASAMRQHLASVYSGDGLPSRRPDPLPSVSGMVPFDLDSQDPGMPSFTADSVGSLMRRLPLRKAPGPDHLRTEMLLPIKSVLAPLLSLLFSICYQWSYTPSLWRQAQVVPIHKKGDPTSPGNYRPISLTSIVRKLFEMCLFPSVEDVSPPLDVAQGGFRHQRSALDQALCLHDLMHSYRRRHNHYPVVAFLDIKSAYDTVDRRIIWQSMLASSAPLSLVSLLANMFDDVSVSVLLQNNVSDPFVPSTGVLQGSVLSPHLYSIYVNTLPALLRSAASATTTSVFSVSPSGPPGPGALVPDGLPFGPLVGTAALSSSSPSPTPINSLLYADDVALVGSAREVRHMLDLAQTHSLTLGYKWSPPKCAVLNAPAATSSRSVQLSLYGQDLPTADEFTYLGVPFNGQGISTSALIKHRSSGTIAAMAQLHSMGLNRQGFPLLLSSRLFAAFIRPELEYGLAIAQLTRKDYDELNRAQDRCLRMLVGGHRTASTVVLRHITNLPSMSFRADTLVLKFCRRFEGLPDDCLLSLLAQSVPVSHLSRLRKRKIVLDCPSDVSSSSRLASWLRKPDPCSCGLGDTSRSHLMVCTLVPSALWCCLPVPPPGYVGHHIDYVLNLLPVSAAARCPPYWSALCQILCHFDKICHPDIEYNSSSLPGQVWIDKSSAAATP
ncbi:hypothetical protein RO3G_05927 [Rhizopus delemar RA 99-880]|uniref:Reverse transcriptase domain-containing protein n=1 Tax=Rhizopus delemar (strain RA 99-880 / ATCC MYA-4621 / FGSC 9543 / NRRL 43880) TaxID=246409 RepID=I1BYE2_RHIO9|nr:hypothetical protein RO3G_05927 [Rhizopus delemar RA 99-880]|eukprot:EIE81222.1 hypothetical protein RO3G_05927 [Rhizopus delemar RA 99-880]